MMQTLKFRAMNTNVLMAAEGHDWAEVGLQATKAYIDECEQRFSRFITESELSQLNRSAGTWMSVSKDLMDILNQSMRFYKETEGVFDPSVLSDLKRIGYDRSMDEIRAEGYRSTGFTSTPIHRPSFAEIEIDSSDSRVRLPQGMEIDLGGIAKGWIVDKAAERLAYYSAICAVNAGGDMLFIGSPMDGSDWQVYLEDPRDPSKTLTLLHTGAGAVATSSVAKRVWQQGGERRHHLIDPRTGEPAITDWLSVTVFNSQVTAAEVYAKALLIGGEGEAAHLFSKRLDLAYLAVDPQGNLVGSSNSKEYLYARNTISIQ